MHVTKKMLYEAQFNIAEGKFDRLKKRFVSMLSRHGGKMDHSALLHNLPIDAAFFKRLVLTLKMCDMIEEEQISARKVVFTMKGAA